SFGGGFSATVAAQSPGIETQNGASGNGTQYGFPNNGNIGGNQGPIGHYDPSGILYGGQRWPDFVGNIHVTQGWGEAQVSGVIHDVNVSAIGYNDLAGVGGTGLNFSCGFTGLATCDSQKNQVGWGV